MEVSKYVGCGLALGIGCTYYWYWKTEGKIKEGSYYEKSVNLLKGYQPAKDIIGEPMKPLKIEIGDKFNVLNDKVAKIAIPIIGHKGSGTLYTWSSKPTKDSDWQVEQLDIEFTSPKYRRWTFYKMQDQKQTEVDE